ncbi:hypothetical protein [Actinacidiphila bryophytorum]|uniref:hypothetical protein n=1 Tax=Actinacidiphila bryophytorum TaxID=1436133 RepID=UPI002176BA84|nr:hypothetical protein [Actinacidiphila bryophytorum]UWE10048.1 hypothetical protein NYE86_15905 [Actinacidiphila bryophytorum]
MSQRHQVVGSRKPLCEGEGCAKNGTRPGGRHGTVPGLRLCPGCREQLVAALAELPALYEACERVLSGGISRRPRETRAAGPSHGLPFNGAAADVRAEIVAFLSSWSGLVAEGRQLNAPQRSVRVLAGFLHRNADWLAAHPAVAEATDEIGRLARRARRVAYPDRAGRLRVGACTESGCNGELIAWIGGQEATASARIQCDAEPGHCWAGHQWTQLRRAMGRAAPTQAGAQAGARADAQPGAQAAAQAPAQAGARADAQAPAQAAAQAPAQADARADAQPAADTECWLTAADIASLWSAPTGTVYRLASQQHWRRRSRAGRTYYAESDVRASFSRRAGLSSAP